jgi:hypothetical protein
MQRVLRRCRESQAITADGRPERPRTRRPHIIENIAAAITVA